MFSPLQVNGVRKFWWCVNSDVWRTRQAPQQKESRQSRPGRRKSGSGWRQGKNCSLSSVPMSCSVSTDIWVQIQPVSISKKGWFLRLCDLFESPWWCFIFRCLIWAPTLVMGVGMQVIITWVPKKRSFANWSSTFYSPSCGEEEPAFQVCRRSLTHFFWAFCKKKQWTTSQRGQYCRLFFGRFSATISNSDWAKPWVFFQIPWVFPRIAWI